MDESDEKRQRTLKIGSNNLLEVGCCICRPYSVLLFEGIEGKQIGDGNVIESKGLCNMCSVHVIAFVSVNTIIGNGCIIGAAARIPPNQIIQDDTIVWGPANNMRTQPNNRDTHQAVHIKHLEILQKNLPNYHHLKQKA